jgi:peptidoglycan/xylan/chitin deacetylase (PgdA/CDA1 family)
MEEHPIRRLILHLLWLAPLAAILLWRASPLLALALLMASHALVLYPTLRATSQWLGPVATSFSTDRREVWLTIDDGPSTETPRVLDLLERFGARATFFIVGRHAEEHPAALAEIARRGHTIGNHSQTHPSGTFWALGPRRISEEIDRCSRTIQSLGAAPPRWFRPPVGMKNPFVHPAARRFGLPVVAWTARGFDAVARDRDKALERLLRDVRPGAIILAHEGRAMNTALLEKLLTRLQSDGYSAVIPRDDQLVSGRRNTSR